MAGEVTTVWADYVILHRYSTTPYLLSLIMTNLYRTGERFEVATSVILSGTRATRGKSAIRTQGILTSNFFAGDVHCCPLILMVL